MSTKNLARTVIEGGRYRYNKYLRRHSHGAARSHVHVLEHRLCTQDIADEAVFEEREYQGRDFRDKLAPARRWLRSQVGRPWDKVRSELFERFDTRTTAGRHILFDHLLRDVEDAKRGVLFRWYPFYISRHGILRYEEWKRPAPRRWIHWLPERESTLLAWLAGRRVLEHGEQLYWLVETRAGGFRQEHRLNEADVRRFRGLPKWFQDEYSGPKSCAKGRN
jgi:hypothetical protein